MSAQASGRLAPPRPHWEADYPGGKMQRPLGITILAIVTLFWGAWSLFKGLVVLGLGGLFGAWASTTFPVAGAVVGVLALTYGIIAIILACFSLGFGFG